MNQLPEEIVAYLLVSSAKDSGTLINIITITELLRRRSIKKVKFCMQKVGEAFTRRSDLEIFMCEKIWTKSIS